MAILNNIFKKKPTKKSTEGKIKLVKEPKSEPIVAKKEKRAGIGCQILKSPHITEKATDLTQKNQYVFKVYPEVNKIELKKAIEAIYGVDVAAVKIINLPRKRRRLGKISGWRKGYKKAIVKIKEGQKIEIMPK
ncbi:MAG: 50S ribosomal protein L23 [Candidatus Nealsonbacteria bacterium CG08_land_8_20_14_0_20_38_20]|uniref:Large ribosomal subunit protein uL23 n=1 Tax=Candidatus Nealsonbacteria bacterium CG08_land_8_20_14_0_20_38_20 TaxID=1974705 RepID=A0A2H0YM65_9BACT|nr:MAG: 50S ribosomal protein L23 [Candidatus Nealsonbacteria bacterium CG08_land_8_20_14_0_20_38_20]